jgi:hypothetical protein
MAWSGGGCRQLDDAVGISGIEPAETHFDRIVADHQDEVGPR